MGWELYIPTEFVQGAYDLLVEEGAAFDMRSAGYHALNSLRMEKGYRHWGNDITDDDTPLECGLGFAVAWSKPDEFIGRDALERQKKAGPKRRMVHVALSTCHVDVSQRADLV
ncbi:glycine cleavage system aminomethyltransferase T [Bradyrhizobium sp. USDA 4473]